ncbi:hypothetical protein, partial [Pseudomonas fluorescens]|uniref:hypothetical protein n=1 Tax=Pseudomonas fluorescens TaxID=294 RepID=UPI001CD65B37
MFYKSWLASEGDLKINAQSKGPFAAVRRSDKPAPMYGLAPTVYPLSKKLPPRCIYVLGLFEEAVIGFWPKLEEL